MYFAKRNETKRNETKRNETKRNGSFLCESRLRARKFKGPFTRAIFAVAIGLNMSKQITVRADRKFAKKQKFNCQIFTIAIGFAFKTCLFCVISEWCFICEFTISNAGFGWKGRPFGKIPKKKSHTILNQQTKKSSIYFYIW